MSFRDLIAIREMSETPRLIRHGSGERGNSERHGYGGPSLHWELILAFNMTTPLVAIQSSH
jgi:hypothetical protein